MSAPLSPTGQLAALLIRTPGATVRAPRKMLAAVIEAHAEADRCRASAALADALARALTAREASLASVPLATVWNYLRDHGWTPMTTDGIWTHDGQMTETPASEKVSDYGVLLWRVADEVGAVEKRPAMLVLADWLVAVPTKAG